MMNTSHPIDGSTWTLVRHITRAGLHSSMHCAIASVNADGTPHLTPIGSVLLDPQKPGHGIYFEVFNTQLASNVDRNPNVCILAVNSSRKIWLKALLKGSFGQSPAARLVGTVGPCRPATEAEAARFERLVKRALRTKGGRAMWSAASPVRDVTVTSFKTIHLGSMTAK
jgi:uncharacterized protein